LINCGASGSTSDCAAFNVSELKEDFEDEIIGLPEPDFLTIADQYFYGC